MTAEMDENDWTSDDKFIDKNDPMHITTAAEDEAADEDDDYVPSETSSTLLSDEDAAKPKAAEHKETH
jgi:hypothetical protein